MFFYATKIISEFLMPWSMVWEVAAILFLVRKGRPRLFKWGIGLCAAALFLMSLDPVKYAILYPLESRSYRLAQESTPRYRDAQAIIVLGGGITEQGKWGPPRLGLDSFYRLNHGMALLRQFKERIPLVFSTGTSSLAGGPPESSLAADCLKEAGLTNYLLEDKSRNTYENARMTKELFLRTGRSLDRPVILVTSALHTPRAVALFKAQGFRVLPSPSHYKIASSFVPTLSAFLPWAGNIEQITDAWHEYLGILAYTMAGKL